MQGDGGHRYNDGQWHSIVATRRGAVGTIVVNNQYRGNTHHIHTDSCVYLFCVCGSVNVNVFACLSMGECACLLACQLCETDKYNICVYLCM